MIRLFTPSGGEQQQGDGQNNQILYRKRETSASSSQHPPSPSTTTSSSSSSSSSSHGSPDRRPTNLHMTPLSPGRSQAAVRAREFAADLFRRAQAGTDADSERRRKDSEAQEAKTSHTSNTDSEQKRAEERREDAEGPSTPHGKGSTSSTTEPEDSVSCNTVMSPVSTSSLCSLSPHASSSTSEPGYVNYTRLRYRLQQPGRTAQDSGKSHTHNTSSLVRVIVCYKIESVTFIIVYRFMQM